MENNTIFMTTTELYASLSTVNTSLTRSAECGPENATVITRRNTAIQIVDTGNFKEPNIVSEHSRHFNIQRRVCMYANVETFEISGTYDLERNEINKIAYTDEAPNLKILNFSSCGMFDTLYKFKHWRSRFPLLKYLDFSHNLIQAIPEITDYGDTKTDPSVGIIDLRNNNISLITKDMINSFSKHKFVHVDIRENPYHCDCRIIEVMKYLELQDMPAQYDFLKSLKCSSPVSVYGKLIASISMDELKCSKETVLNITVIIIIVGIITTFIITTLIIHFRNITKVILYTRLNITFPCFYKNDNKHDKKYDAFIAYSEADADWVLHTALPKLESGGTDKSFKLCVHHRDFTIGAAVADNIIESVQSSLHTILIVSNNFLKSKWCMMEFRTALHESLLDKNHHIIIVLKDNICFDNLDHDFKNFISTQTYLKIGDRLFWDKLKFAISFQYKKT